MCLRKVFFARHFPILQWELSGIDVAKSISATIGGVKRTLDRHTILIDLPLHKWANLLKLFICERVIRAPGAAQSVLQSQEQWMQMLQALVRHYAYSHTCRYNTTKQGIRKASQEQWGEIWQVRKATGLVMVTKLQGRLWSCKIAELHGYKFPTSEKIKGILCFCSFFPASNDNFFFSWMQSAST